MELIIDPFVGDFSRKNKKVIDKNQETSYTNINLAR